MKHFRLNLWKCLLFRAWWKVSSGRRINKGHSHTFYIFWNARWLQLFQNNHYILSLHWNQQIFYLLIRDFLGNEYHPNLHLLNYSVWISHHHFHTMHFQTETYTSRYLLLSLIHKHEESAPSMSAEPCLRFLWGEPFDVMRFIMGSTWYLEWRSSH